MTGAERDRENAATVRASRALLGIGVAHLAHLATIVSFTTREVEPVSWIALGAPNVVALAALVWLVRRVRRGRNLGAALVVAILYGLVGTGIIGGVAIAGAYPPAGAALSLALILTASVVAAIAAHMARTRATAGP